MSDPLMTHLVAKAKALGLVAGTALVTAALVGGGAVAVTAVSAEGELPAEVVVDAPAAPEELSTTQVTSDSPTVPIEQPSPPAEAPKTKTPPPLPTGFTCDPTKNHGQNVSAYARSLPKGPGRGEKVSAVAQSDCGKKAKPASEEPAGTAEAAEPKPVQPPKAAKPAKPAKPAQPQQKADRPAPPAAPESKGNGKGNGKGSGKPGS